MACMVKIESKETILKRDAVSQQFLLILSSLPPFHIHTTFFPKLACLMWCKHVRLITLSLFWVSSLFMVSLPSELTLIQVYTLLYLFFSHLLILRSWSILIFKTIDAVIFSHPQFSYKMNSFDCTHFLSIFPSYYSPSINFPIKRNIISLPIQHFSTFLFAKCFKSRSNNEVH